MLKKIGILLGFVFCLGLIVSPVSVYAASIYVDEDNCSSPGTGTEADPYCSVHDAINAAVDGDEILIHDGTYYENLDLQGKDLTIVMLSPMK